MTVTAEVVETKLEEEYFIDEEGSERPEGYKDEEEGNEVTKGGDVHTGVAIEELRNFKGHRELKNECPADVREMLQEKDLFDTYDKFVQAIVDEKTTRGKTGRWKDQEFNSVLDQFREDFAAKGVKVAFCKRKSFGSGHRRWLEFIDVDKLGGSYVPQFDVDNMSGQVINTCYTKLEFPNGVAVEELKRWGGRKALAKLKEKVPVFVEKMLEKYDLMKEYEQMVDHVVEAGVGIKSKQWNIEKLKELMKVYQPMFSDKGVDIYVSHKQEWISHGSYGGHFENFRWIEFVDREVQPTYKPQRDAETKQSKDIGDRGAMGDSCAIM